MSKRIRLDRRTFLVGSAATGGLALGFHVPFGLDEAAAQKAASKAGSEVNAWVYIKPNDTVVIRIARSEMGQGTLTGLAQLVAEELECDWKKVTTEYPTPGQNLARNRVWGDMSTGGSRGIRTSQEYVRKGGAAARQMLLQAAADQWKVPVAELAVANGVITHTGSKRTTTYGKVAAAAAKLQPPDPKEIKLKDPKTWKIAGQSMKRLDTADKLNGKQVYAIDLKLPGMLNAAIKDCPVFGGKVKSYDEAKVKDMPGVRHVVKVGESAVAVVGDTWWQAKKALDALPIVWDEGPNAGVSSASIAERLKEGLDAPEAAIGQKIGDAAGTIAGAAKKVEAVYASPYVNHATMEPMNCTAKMTADRCEVWVPTQSADAALAAASEASGLPQSKCEVYKFHLGGGFGRRGAFHDYVKQAVLIAKQIPDVPIKLVWSREEDMTHGFYRPVSQCKLSAGLDDKGNLVGLHMRLSGPSILHQLFPQRLEGGVDRLHFQGLLADEFAYSIPNLLIDHALRATHVPIGFWRGVNHNQNAIFMESFIDEVAHAAGKDPLDFRRAMMRSHPKQLNVLNAAAEKAGWTTPPPAGVFRGICQNTGFGSHCAAVAEVSVDQGKLKVHRLVIAVDCGIAVNPDQIAAQVEGSVVYGLGAALYQENTVKDGRIVEENFDSFESMMLAEMPKVETVLVPSGGFWGGIGEPTIAVAAPAVLNAIFAATGKRVRTLPLKHVKLT
ncbi:MAG TPA: molybdopterin cofactor-binding domain-containing protein [Hyphomicrobiaceae bacterium]|nr:molybdopterin cofactor-binding domain-containing protein [Hyphomicrobiaceae bacterium]